MSKVFFRLISILATGLFIFSDDGKQYHFGVLFSSFIISVFCLFQVFQRETRPYSLNKMFYIFILFFAGIAPAVQFKYRRYYWGGRSLSESEYLQMNIVFILVIVIYLVAYTKFLTKDKQRLFNFIYLKSNFRNPIDKSNLRRILIISASLSFILFFYTKGFNFQSLILRGGGNMGQEVETSTAVGLIINVFLRPIPVIALLIYRYYYNKFDWFELSLLIIVLFSNTPTGMARFQAAALYMPVAISYAKPLRRKFNFVILLIGGLLFVFPFLNYFRNFDSSTKFNIESNIFLSPDFDSYYNFALLANEGLITYGYQLLGVVLFYFPRSLWPSKPIGSGALLAENMNLGLDNISMNFFGEGFINFGWFGVGLFAIILAYINSYFDNLYWRNSNNLLIKLTFLFFLGMEFFVLRGDLLSSFAFTFGLLLSVLIIYRLTTTSKIYDFRNTDKKKHKLI